MAPGHSSLKGLLLHLLKLPELSRSSKKSCKAKANNLQPERTLLIRRDPVWGSVHLRRAQRITRGVSSALSFVSKTDTRLAELLRAHARLRICFAQPREDLGWILNLAFGTTLEKRCGLLGECPEEKNKEEQSSRKHDLQGDTEKMGVV